MDSVKVLITQTHPVDREALRLWSRVRETGQAHRFLGAVRQSLYGNRYWPRVRSIVASQDPGCGSAVERAFQAAGAATRTARVDEDQLLGIAFVAVDMFDHLGPEGFLAVPDRVLLSQAALLETPTMVLRRRANNSPEGLLGRWRGDRRRWRITHEPDSSSHYTVVHGDVLAPCRGGSHEHCDVGIVAGADRVSPCEGSDPFPLIRRACQTRVFGRISLLAATL